MNRILWMDNVRTAMIFLVVLLHAGIVYESGGGGALFWIVDDPATTPAADFLNWILDIGVMPAIFFVSGFFVIASLRKRGGWGFLKSKVKRLLIPWAAAVAILMPLYKVIYLASRSLPQESWTAYFHFSNGIFSQSWLWFLPVLFLFDLLFLLFSRIGLDLSRIPFKIAAPAAFISGLAYMVGMNVFHGEGWTKTPWIDFQNERLLIYFLIFLLGALAFERKTLFSLQRRPLRTGALIGVAWIPVYVYVNGLRSSGMVPGGAVFSGLGEVALLRLAYLVSVAAWLYLTTDLFRTYLDRQGRIGRALSRNSYGVYIIHVVVIGAIAWAMLDLALSGWLKLVVLTAAAYAASNLIVGLYRNVLKAKIMRGT